MINGTYTTKKIAIKIFMPLPAKPRPWGCLAEILLK